MGPYAMQTWGSFIAFAFASALFFASTGAPAWWVEYYNIPEDLKPKLQFGLWKLCVREYCVYDMTDKYMVRSFLPEEAIPPYFQGALIPAQVLMGLNIVLVITTAATYLAFIVGKRTYFIECLLQFIIAVFISASLATFGRAFRGTSDVLPFGYAFWLGVVSAFFFVVNCIVMTFISGAMHNKHLEKQSMEKM